MGLQTIVSTNENSDDDFSSSDFAADPSFAHDNDELSGKGGGDDVATTLSSLPHGGDDDEDEDDGDDPYEDEFNSSVKGSSSDKTGDETPKIAEGEARAVVASKYLVAIVLVLSAALLGYISYEYTRQEEVNGFHTKFLDYADEIARSGVNNAHNSFTVLQSFSRTVTSLANYGNETWPFMSLPDFEVRAHDYQIISGAEEVAFAPIVGDNSREAFEQYTADHQEWIQRGLDYEYLVAITQQEEAKDDATAGDKDTTTIAPGTNMEGFSIINKAKPIQEFIWKHAPQTNRAVPETGRGPHVPIWQTYPAPRNSYVVNHNLRSVPEFEHLIATAIANRTTVLSDVVDNFALFGRAQTIDLDPKSIVVQPIFKHSSHTDIDGFLIVIKKWDMYFQNVLYKGAQPLVCVLKNSCGKAFSYKITGPRAEFLGEGDLHDPDYDDMVVVEEFKHTQLSSACQFWFEVYPTRSMEQASKSSMPLYVTLIVMGVFGFTSLVFLLYDYLVSRRQQTTLASANATNRIVSNLFPKAVRDRLIQEMELQDHAQKDADHNSHSFSASPNSSLERQFKKKKNKRMSIRQSITAATVGSSPKPSTGSGAFLNISLHGSNHSRSGGGGGAGSGGFGTSEDIFGSKPIAELFPATTIMFADMVGFTAWSSVRDPTQVFTLLETIYHAFDTIAKRRRVFKVETIGDCYVAVAGLPMPRKDHAIVMARFSSECLAKMDMLTKNLEATLGPDTGDLSLRIGLHSGPVTAGVLRGEKGRFQLFGDTMNTASRMESTGTRGKIQVSRETAHLLRSSGKEKWVTERDEKVNAKGKGELQTFWLQIKASSENNDGASVISSTSHGEYSSGNQTTSAERANTRTKRDQMTRMTSTRDASNMLQEMASAAKSRRLIEWNAEILGKLLKQIVLRRVSRKIKKRQLGILGVSTPKESRDQGDTTFEMVSPSGPAIDEVQDIISLPHFDPKNFARNVDPNSVEIPETVLVQLNIYVSRIADLYQDNPFHSFEHASHVTMSVTKLMSRIVNPLQVDGATGEQNRMLHDHTFGITSDPLTQFACVLSALIHDADHPGVGNSVLVKENDPLAIKYNNKSVAEQNSVDLAWNILMEDTFEDLRALIYTNAEEFKRFRQIIVNVVLATDIMDKELGALRRSRWDKAFNSLTNSSNHGSTHSSLHGSATFKNEDTSSSDQEAQYDVNRKATIVLEHLIQASDVSHTMQHWHVYRKWNERLFQEVYQAYLDGRIDTNPADGWYKGEIGFFDFYIIPLAKKLETCGVFGVSSHEYLGYAEGNRREWEEKGESIVADYLAKYQPEQAPLGAIGE